MSILIYLAQLFLTQLAVVANLKLNIVSLFVIDNNNFFNQR